MSTFQDTAKVQLDEFTQTNAQTLTIELDMKSYDEDKARQVASDFANRIDGEPMSVEDESPDLSEALDSSGERRRHTRTPSTLPARALRVIGDSPLEKPVKGFVVNLSLAGMAIISESEELCKGDVIEIEISDGVIPFSVSALVVKKTALFGASKPHFSYGLRIMKMNQQARSSIERIVSGRPT